MISYSLKQAMDINMPTPPPMETASISLKTDGTTMFTTVAETILPTTPKLFKFVAMMADIGYNFKNMSGGSGTSAAAASGLAINMGYAWSTVDCEMGNICKTAAGEFINGVVYYESSSCYLM